MSVSTASRSLTVLSLAGASCLALASPALAQEAEQAPGQQLAGLGEILPDPELAEMRGKFVRQDNVSFFGITMVTSWQDAQGITTNARLVFNVDFLNPGTDGKPMPALMIGWAREGDPAMDVTDTNSGYVPFSSANVDPVGGIGTHQGAAQANVIAGSDNLARNNLQIAIVPASAIPALSMAGMQIADGPTEFGFADGDQLRFQLGSNQIGIVMTGADGLDSSLQSLGGNMGQVLQQTMLATDGNSIFNSASIVLGADNFGQSESVTINNALSAMKGHGY